MFKKILLTSILITNILYASSINVAVATNVSYAINDLKKEFNKLYPKTKIRVTLASSGKLTAQIKNGAPYNLFMSANMLYPNSLYEDKIAINKPVIYAKGSLVLLSAKKRDLLEGLNLTTAKKIKKIAIANPKIAPYGKATIEALKNAKLYENIKKKFIYAESITQAISYTITASDIGFVAKSSLFSPKMKRFKENIHWIDIDSKLYTPINQGIVILENSKDNKEVKAFYNFILSEKAKKIFEEFGYIVSKVNNE